MERQKLIFSCKSTFHHFLHSTIFSYMELQNSCIFLCELFLFNFFYFFVFSLHVLTCVRGTYLSLFYFLNISWQMLGTISFFYHQDCQFLVLLNLSSKWYSHLPLSPSPLLSVFFQDFFYFHWTDCYARLQLTVPLCF